MEILPPELITLEPFHNTQSIPCKLTIVTEKYEDSESMINVLQYVPNGSYEKTAYGIGCSSSPNIATAHYEQIRNLHNITDGSLLRHYIIGFDYAPHLINPTTLPYIAYQIAMFFAPRYQVYYGLHEYSDSPGQYHIHFIVNTTNIQTGKRIPRTPAFRDNFCQYVNTLSINGLPLLLTPANNYI